MRADTDSHVVGRSAAARAQHLHEHQALADVGSGEEWEQLRRGGITQQRQRMCKTGYGQINGDRME